MAEGARLEIVCTERYRGFESLSLRPRGLDSHGTGLGHRPGALIEDIGQPLRDVFMVPGDATAVNPARSGRKQR